VAAQPKQGSSSLGVIVAAVAIVVIVGGVFAWRLQRDVRAAAQQAEQSQVQARSAEQASRAASEKQAAADQQLVLAHDLASKAQTIGDVLAAPDLVRYALTNAGTLPGASGQVLWSRSRGFVFSASGLPAPAAGATYQVWLLTRGGGAVSAATFVPDDAGRVTVTTALNIPRAVVGAIVTTEQKNGASTPTGEPVLARVPVVPAPQS
jgi:type II secretory pathway pseudopilin PulG